MDVKSKTITLGVLTPLSGPAALIGKPLTAGQQAYFKLPQLSRRDQRLEGQP